MKTKAKNRFIKVLLGITLIFLFSSCHSKYLSVEIRTKGSTVVWNKDSSAFAFIAKTRFYRMPVGIAKFPDGGMTKTEYQDFSLYHYNIKHKKLTHLISLNEFYLVPAYRWIDFSQINLKLKDSLLFYKLTKPYFKVKYIDKEKPNFLKDISNTYSINIHTHQKSVVDTTIFQNIVNPKRERVESSSARKYLPGIKYSDWGINLKELYPQSKSTYIDYIIQGEGNENMRQAIFEQIAPDFTKKDKNKIIAEMTNNQKHFLAEYNHSNRKLELKNRYIAYYNYIKEIKKKLNIPFQENKFAEQEKTLKNLKSLGINIPNDFKFTELVLIGEGYDAEFKLQEADSIKIQHYKNWFRNLVASFRGNKWEIDEQTVYEKPNSYGIVVRDEINFIWEHTGLKLIDKKGSHFLILGINYNVKSKDKSKSFTFSVSKEDKSHD